MADASAIQVSEEKIAQLGDRLLNKSGSTPLHTRFRALFTLKSLCTPESSSGASARTASVINIIGSGLDSPAVSPLLRHELAYVLGQIGSTHAIPVLEETLQDVQGQEEMVRHEAAEALAAIGKLGEETVELLRRFAKAGGRGGKDDGRVVRETCEVALAKIVWDRSEEARKSREEGQSLDRQFVSVDPAPPLIAHSPLAAPPTSAKVSSPNTITDIKALRAALLDTHLQLFTRYRAMFALRNIGTVEAIDALCAGFEDDSALFKHEIAFILGQLADPHSIPALVEVLKRENESPMVRHEAAEALGGIPSEGSDGGAVLRLLREWAAKTDAPAVLRDSCVVAVDMWEYENSNEFQYADGLVNASQPVVAAT